MDKPAVRQLVKFVLNEEARAMRHQPFGHHSVTYDVALASRRVMVRMHPEPKTFEGTTHTIETLRALGLPVPRIVRIDCSLDAFPFAYAIFERFEGQDLRYELPSMTAVQIELLASQIAGFQRTVGQLPLGRGYGWAPIGSPALHASWTAAVEADHANWPDSRLGESLRAILQRFRPELDALPPLCFLDDVTTKNVIVHNGALTGLVDLDAVCYGDPMYMLGLTATAIVADLGAEHLTYVQALRRHWPVTDAQYRRACLYSALFGVDFLARGAGESAGWAASMERAITGWIAFAGQAS